MMANKTIGVIGTGSWGQNIIRTLIDLEQSVISYNTQNDWRKLIDQRVDGIVVAADPRINLRVCEYANEANIPVMIEKPVSLYLSDVEKIAKLSIPVLVDYIHLFNDDYQELKSKLTSPIIRVASIGYNNGPFRNFTPIFDYGPHDLSLCMDLCPDEFKIVKRQLKDCKNGGLLYRMQFQSGLTDVLIHCGNGGTEKVRRLGIWCKNGEQFALNDKPSMKPLENAIKHFLDIIDGEKMKIPFELSMRIHKTLYQLGANNERN